MNSTQGTPDTRPSAPPPALSGAGRTPNDHLMHTAENWAEVVRRLRLVYGLTQTRVGDIFGVSQRTVSRWERSESRPGAQRRRRLREFEWELSEALAKSPVASAPAPSPPGSPADTTDQDDLLLPDHMPIAVADRIINLLACLSAEDIERLPAQVRRRLTEQCRKVTQLANPRRGTSPQSEKANGSPRD